ncbi:TlpA family protein disulfide reductase [Chitinophaga sedimenti]|uniref:TlpA family protein disulfide reductase n=1 Tax=Chitinophaga sedimenti TaxID=2033606 RepID=UPI00355647EA
MEKTARIQLLSRLAALTGLTFALSAQTGICQKSTNPDQNVNGLQTPNLKWHTVVNHPSPTLDLSQYRGKIVILDFWNTYCGACIKQFPKMDSIQEKYKDDLKIVLIDSKASEDKPEKKSLRLLTGFRIKLVKSSPCQVPMRIQRPTKCSHINTFLTMFGSIERKPYCGNKCR